jgi:23S rRNA (pseudouridine1915-N3)-methyltransferase
MITVVAVGQKQPPWVNDGYNDYANRFPSDQRLKLIEVKAEPRTTGKTVEAMKAAEAERIVAAISKTRPSMKSSGRLLSDVELIALDERGKSFTTEEFMGFLQKLKAAGADRSGGSGGRQLVFLIGGPDGLDDALKERCTHQIRLSAMTLPHGLARVLLAEQIYRAWSLENNHPYHRA